MVKQKRITIEKNIKQDIFTKRYYVTFYHGKDMSGRNIRKTRTYTTLEEARYNLRKHEADKLSGIAIAPNRITVNTAIEQHLAMLTLKSEQSTLYGYQIISKHVKNHILGEKLVQDIKPSIIQAYLMQLQTDKGLSSNTALKHYNFLNSVFNILEQQEIILRNPVKRVVAPKKIAYKPEYLTLDEAKAILKRIKGTRMELPFTLGIYTGMRRGELCGLKWNCIDFNNNIIYIKLNRLNIGNQILTKLPKSDSSERAINIVSELKNVLLNEQKRQQYNRNLLGDSYINNDYIICFNNGEPIRPNYLSEIFKRWFSKKENSDLHSITPHELRHSFVAFAIAAGIPLYDISQALGHNDIGITSKIYAHLLDKTHRNVTEGMAGYLHADN